VYIVIEIEWSAVVLSPPSPCRSRLLPHGPVHRVLLGAAQRQALRDVAGAGLPPGGGAGEAHVGGGRLHLQLQLLPDGSQVSRACVLVVLS